MSDTSLAENTYASCRTPESDACRVAPLAKDLLAMITQLRRIDAADAAARMSGDSKVETGLKIAERALFDRIDCTTNYATCLVADSGVGALLQVHIVHTLVSTLTDCIVDNDDGHSIDKTARAVDRLLYSLQGFIAKLTGASPDEAAADYFLPARLNPFLAVEMKVSD